MTSQYTARMVAGDTLTDPRFVRSRHALALAIRELAKSSSAPPTISAVTGAANVHRATFYNHFSSVEEVAAYAISLGFDEFKLLDYGDRHLGVDPRRVGPRTLRGILEYLLENRELYRLASSWRPRSGLTGVTDLLVEQVHSLRLEFAGERVAIDEIERTEDIFIASAMEGVFAAAIQGSLGSDLASVAEILFALLPGWMREPSS